MKEKLHVEQVSEAEYGDESDETDTDEDEEYEYNGGDNALYDSLTDDIDELKTMKETLEGIFELDKDHYARLMAGVPKEEIEVFKQVLGGIQHLIKDEDETQKKLDEVRKANGEDSD